MSLKKISDILIKSSSGRIILADITYPENNQKNPVVLFVHGFKGFKDWGHFNLVAKTFAEAGFAFMKFNFSHNGTTPEHPIDFADLEAFGNNNFSKEMDDLGSVIDWLEFAPSVKDQIYFDQLYLMGHSRGGGLAVLKSSEDARIKKLLTWAAVSDFEKRINPPNVDQWEKEGVYYVMNSRTGQQMPHYYQFREDFYAHKERFDIHLAASQLKIPYLIIHGTNDEGVSFEEAKELHAWARDSELMAIPEAGHTFGAKHPFEGEVLPPDAAKVVQASIDFFKK